MQNDQSPPEFVVPPDGLEKAGESSSRLRNCLFLSITFVLVTVLAGSSLLTYFLVTSHDRQKSQIPTSDPTQLPQSQTSANQDERIAPSEAPGRGPSSATRTEPPTSGAVNRIVLINPDGQVETIGPTGEDRRILTLSADNRIYQFPAWAPEGNELAVIGSSRTGSGIYLLKDNGSANSADAQELYFSTNQAPIYLYWSPTNTNLGFLANRSPSTIGLNIVDRDGRNRLLATGTPFYWDWTDDGQQLLIHSGQRALEDNLAFIDLEGNPQAENVARPGYFQAPGIAPGGRYWAFAEQTGQALSSLAVFDTTTGERRQYEQAGSLALSWSPTHDQIAYTSGSVNAHPLWGTLNILDVATGQKRVLSQQTVIAFFWSPDGRSIAFITLNGTREGDEIIAGAPPSKTRQVSRIIAPVQQTDRDFLSLSVIDVASGRGMRLLDFTPTPIFVAQFLPYFDQYALSHRIWSPNSDAIVLPVRKEGLDVILTIPVDGGRPQQIAEGNIAFWSIR